MTFAPRRPPSFRARWLLPTPSIPSMPMHTRSPSGIRDLSLECSSSIEVIGVGVVRTCSEPRALDAVLGRPRRFVQLIDSGRPLRPRCRTAVPQRHPATEANIEATLFEPRLMLPQALQFRALLRRQLFVVVHGQPCLNPATYHKS